MRKPEFLLVFWKQNTSYFIHTLPTSTYFLYVVKNFHWLKKVDLQIALKQYAYDSQLEHTHVSDVATDREKRDLYKNALILWSNLETLNTSQIVVNYRLSSFWSEKIFFYFHHGPSKDLPADKNCIWKIKHLGKGLAFLRKFLKLGTNVNFEWHFKVTLRTAYNP